MKTAIIGKKVGMTQIFDEAGYEAVQLGYEDVAEKKLTKPEKGHLDKAGVG